MSKKTRLPKEFIEFFATGFYVGYIPPASGSMASLLGLLIYVLFHEYIVFYLILTVVFTFIGFLVSGQMEKIVGRKDPSCVVVDEIAGMMIALIGLPVEPAVMITGFFLFRAFDMFKIYPAHILEQKSGSIGIMTDDLIAGVYANAVMHLALKIVYSLNA